MRILHTADLHLGRQFTGLSLEEDHEVILGQILETLLAERAEVLVIAGDVFDRASPPNSSIRQFNHFLKRVADETEAAVVMISGNHDSGDRIEAMSVFSTASRVLVRGIADAVETPLLLSDEHGEIAFSALPFSYEYAAREVFGDDLARRAGAGGYSARLLRALDPKRQPGRGKKGTRMTERWYFRKAHTRRLSTGRTISVRGGWVLRGSQRRSKGASFKRA